MRPELLSIRDALLEASAETRAISLDAVGEAIGTRAVAPDEIEALLASLEASGRTILGPEGGGGEARLKAVLTAARALGPELGRKPTIAEIATRAGLSEEQVRHALALARVMQR